MIELRDIKHGKYFKIVADVFIDSISLGNMLIKKGFAVPYDGGTKNKDLSLLWVIKIVRKTKVIIKLT